MSGPGSGLEIVGGGRGPRLGRQGVPAPSCWWPDAVASAAILSHLTTWRQNPVQDALQSRRQRGENVTWNTILEILPGTLALRSVMGLSWVRCTIFFFFFLNNINLLLWLDKIYTKMTRMDRCLLYFYISVGRNVKKLFLNWNLSVQF